MDRGQPVTPEVVVIGAGPAGCAAAIALARGGRRVLVLERAAEVAESVCGEFLGADAAAALDRLGLDLDVLGACRLARVEVGSGGVSGGCALPFPAWALSRRVLDGALQQAARQAGALLRMGAGVVAAAPAPGGWEVRRAGGESWVASALVLATGKHALRGHPRAGAGAGPGAGALGLKLHLRGVEPGAATILLPFAGGYAGLQPVPGGGANLCAALWGEPGTAARDAAALLARVAAGSALAARRLAGAIPLWPRPLAVAGVPYGFRFPPADSRPGLYRVGDQAAVIPSFTGEGMALALHSGLAAAEAILAGRDSRTFHQGWAHRAARPMRWADLAGQLLQRAPHVFALGTLALPPAARLLARRTRVGA